MNVENLHFLGTDAILASPRMRELFAQIRKAALSDATVLLEGEAGSGKETVARAIHHYSGRHNKAFVELSCAALSESQAETELFGQDQPGLLATTEGGTLYLSEVGCLTPALQAKLLSLPQTKSYAKRGGDQRLRANVRIIASTPKKLELEAGQGPFREDLSRQLQLHTFHIPALRERPEEIEVLARLFLAQQNPDLHLATDARLALYAYAWPGNVQELRSTILRSARRARGPLLHADDLEFQPRTATGQQGRRGNAATGRQGIPGSEPTLIHSALEEAGGVRRRAARALGISPRTLSRKISSYDLGPQQQRKFIGMP
jgi:two-component system response regulator HydG